MLGLSGPFSKNLSEQFHGGERLGRPRPEATEGKFGFLSGIDIHEDVVVILLGRLAPSNISLADSPRAA